MALVNRYLGKFSAEGKPEGFLLEGVNYKTPEEKAAKMNQGYVELTQEEWEYYTNNRGSGDNGTGYIRDPRTGRPVSAPARVYTKVELADMAKGIYEAQVNELDNEIIKMSALGNQEAVDEINEEKQQVLAEYAQVLQQIEEGQITKPEQIQPAAEV